MSAPRTEAGRALLDDLRPWAERYPDKFLDGWEHSILDVEWQATYPDEGKTSDGRLVGRSLPDQRRNEDIVAGLRTTLKELLAEARSGQHRHDRQDRECRPMEEAIERAEIELARRLR